MGVRWGGGEGRGGQMCVRGGQSSEVTIYLSQPMIVSALTNNFLDNSLNVKIKKKTKNNLGWN